MAVPISNVTRRAVYAPSGTGGVGPYAFTFEILANTDIAVFKDNTLLTLTTHYTVTINANGTGSVTITAAGLALSPTSPTQYAVVGNRTIARTSDFTTGGDFFANTLNDELDQQTIFAQQNAEGLQRALQAPQTDPTTINMTLPAKASRALKTLSFDSDGNPTPGVSAADVANAVTYATNAANSATAAASSASAASSSASAASSSASTASTQASNASTSASNASTSASGASTSATNAATSASTATTQATNASTSASNASTSATNAASSASAASTSASNASASASSAASAQTAAEAARDSALAAYDNFDDRYLGAKSSNPTVDNDGNTLLAGALYFNTVVPEMRLWTGSAWVAAYVSGSGFIAATGGTMTGPLNFPDGSAASPSITNDGDTNTGIFFPAADTIAFAEGGAEVARFDSSGNFGLGVTPSAWGSYSGAMDFKGGGALGAFNSSTALFCNSYYNGTNYIYKASTSAGFYQIAGNQHQWYNAASGTAGNTASFTQAMTLDANGNLLLGTTTANANFYVYNAPVSYAGLNATAIFSSSASQSTGTGGLIAFEGKYTSGGALANFAAIGGLKENSTDNNYSGYLGFYTRSNGSLAAERARIDSSGNLLVGTTSGSGKVTIKGGNGNQLYLDNAGEQFTQVTFINNGTPKSYMWWDNTNTRFQIQSGASGGVYLADTGTSWTSVSDERVKDIVESIENATQKLSNWRAVIGKYKTDEEGTRRSFLIAQDVLTTFPEAVDTTNNDEFGLSYQDLIPVLVKAIQEQQALITQLTARITALESA